MLLVQGQISQQIWLSMCVSTVLYSRGIVTGKMYVATIFLHAVDWHSPQSWSSNPNIF